MTVDDIQDLDPEWVKRTREIYTGPIASDRSILVKWLELIKYTQSLNGGIVKNSSAIDKQLLVMTYQNVLERFPCLEKIWCELSDWYFKIGDTETCYKNYQLALQVTNNSSLIIWCEYLKFYRIYKSNDEIKLIKEFEKARISIGLHYHSDEFYDMYLDFLWQYDLKQRYYCLLRRILEVPLYNYAKYFHKWFKLIDNSDLDTIKMMISMKDLSIRFQIRSVSTLTNTELSELKLKLKKAFIDLYITTQYHSYQLYAFEKKICHNFYTPVPSGGNDEKSQDHTRIQELPIWEKYLQYMETQTLQLSNTKDKLNAKIQLAYVHQLYKRCLIINPDQEKVWLKYMNFLISINDFQEAIEIAETQALAKFIPNSIPLVLKTSNVYKLNPTKQNIRKAYELVSKYHQKFPHDVKLLSELVNLSFKIGMADDEVLALVRDTILSQQQNQDFDLMLIDIQDYKRLSVSKLKEFLLSFQTTTKATTSTVYWKILIEFIKLNDPDSLQEILGKKNELFEDSTTTSTTTTIKDKDITWLDQF